MVRRDSSTTSAVIVYWWSWSPCSSLAGAVSMTTFDDAVGADRDFVLQHDFRLLLAAGPTTMGMGRVQPHSAKPGYQL